MTDEDLAALLLAGGVALWLKKQNENDVCTRMAKYKLPVEYLQGARYNFRQSKSPTRFANVKSDARNFLQSIVKHVTGKESVSEGLKEMKNLKIIGETDYETIKNWWSAFSKQGPHPPLPTQHDAQLALVQIEWLANKILFYYESGAWAKALFDFKPK